ncbi:hypothetical protein B7494_g2354 [Chlorociboria aeruginascens]|nr:hypothetical protein B7494_g2354 [Chlorociboria aeruginascens]
MILSRQDAGPPALPISYDDHGGAILAVTGFFTSFACLVALARFIELNSGILAACFPALRPLFSFILETASSHLRSSQRRNSVISNSRHRYYVQDDDIKLNSLPSHSTMMGSPGYGVTVSGGTENGTLYSSPSVTSTGPTSKLEQSIEENDSGSDENILPALLHQVYAPGRDPRRGIMRTTEVMITR